MEHGNHSSSSRRVFSKGLLVLAIVSLVLQIIGLATPGWIVMYVESPTLSLDVSEGLWAVNYCINGVCGTQTNEEFYRGFSFYTNLIGSHLDEYRAETIIGVVAMLSACVCLLFQICNKPSNVPQATWFKICGVCSSVSAILSLVAAGQFGRQLADSNTLLERFSPYLIPYSVILTGVGGILAAILFIICLVQACRQNDMSNQQQAVNMETFPVQGRPQPVNPQLAKYPYNMNSK